MKRRGPWLLAALLLLLLGVWVMPSIDTAHQAPESEPKVRFPRYPNSEQVASIRRRRTLVPSAPSSSTDNGSTDRERRDPLLVALPPKGDLVVFEIKAFLQSPVGAMLAACLDDDGRLLSATKRGALLDSVERVAVGGEGDGEVLVFAGEKLTAPEGQPTRAYGEHGQLFEDASPEIEGATFRATWKDELLLMGGSEKALTDALDRLEGRAEQTPSISAWQAYGDLYGRVAASRLAAMFPDDTGAEIAASNLEVVFHVDATADVLLSADAYGSDEQTRSIGRWLAAGLGAQRFKAVAEGDEKLSELLDLFSLETGDDGFQLNAAFSRSFVERTLGQCATRAPKVAAPQPAAGVGG